MADKTLIQVRFSKTTPEGLEYHDALYFTQDEFDKHSPDEIAVLKQDRFDAWVAVIKLPEAAPIEPTKEELREMISKLEAELATVQVKLDSIKG